MTRRATTAVSRRRGSGAVASFVSLTNWARPAFAPSRTVTFTTKAGLDSAISGMLDGDLIEYAGSGTLAISSASSNGYTISSKAPATKVVIDFGCSRNVWDASKVTANYVQFSYTGTTSFASLYLHDNSNLTLYGSDLTGGNTGIFFYGATNNVTFWDFTSHDVGAGGIAVTPVNGDITNCSIRGEVYNFGQNPSLDDHPDKGTGQHCCLIENTGSSTHNYDSVTVAIYGHDSLPQSASWPEGGGGSCIEIGSSRSTAQLTNMTLYAHAENFYMEPGNGTNPGSTSVQTGGNCFNLWGTQTMPGLTLGWAEGVNTTGTVVHCASGSWTGISPSATVNHGRHTNTNLYTGGGNAAPNNVPYPTGFNVSYNDCT